MDISVEEVLNKLNVSQLKNLITLFGLEKPHSKSTKSDMINHIKNSGSALDAKMLINYFNLEIKQPKKAKQPKETKIHEVVVSESVEEIKSNSIEVLPKKSPKQKKTTQVQEI